MRCKLLVAMLFCAPALVGYVTEALAEGGAAVHGYVVTCPAGDPLPGIWVHIFVNGEFQFSVACNEFGRYDASVWLPNCDPFSNFVTVTIGQSAELYGEYHHDHCPAGKGGSPPNCCVQVARNVACGSYAMSDLEMRCGVSGAPPCPSQ